MTWRFFCKSCDAPLGTMILDAKPKSMTGRTTATCPTCGETYDYELDDLRED